MENTRVENPVTPEVFIEAMAELGIAFPLTRSQRFANVLLDADGDQLLTIDFAGAMPDNTVALLAANIVTVLNNAASVAVKEPLDWITVAKLAGELGIRYPTNAAMGTFLQSVSGSPVPSVVVNAVEAVWKQSLVIESSVRRGDGPCQYRDVKEALELVKQARASLSGQVLDTEKKLTPEEAWTILCETPDITSPAEYPDHALITMEQLRSYMERAAPIMAGGGEQWWPISAAPKDGTEFIGRCGPDLPSFSCFWDGLQFVHSSHGEGYIAYPVKEWIPMPGSSELNRLATYLKSLISENPEKARLAASREDLRMWFLSELIAVASGTIPLTEIEAIVFQHLAPAEGGEA